MHAGRKAQNGLRFPRVVTGASWMCAPERAVLVNGPTAEQIFINDPSGNMVELHQVDQCRCRVANRV